MIGRAYWRGHLLCLDTLMASQLTLKYSRTRLRCTCAWHCENVFWMHNGNQKALARSSVAWDGMLTNCKNPVMSFYTICWPTVMGAPSSDTAWNLSEHHRKHIASRRDSEEWQWISLSIGKEAIQNWDRWVQRMIEDKMEWWFPNLCWLLSKKTEDAACLISCSAPPVRLTSNF